ncbi:MAG: Cytochrome c551/c552 [Candidatus Nitrotoga sp. LAW]|nr:MAG: Cytochrome c551/c552 [Candidatus Nitrotoga sp. LAW]
MKQSRFVIVIAVLALSACGNKSEQEPAANPASPPLSEHKTTVIPDSPMTTPTKDKIPEMALPAPTTVTPIAPEKTGKPPKANDGVKDELLSHQKAPGVKHPLPIITGQPIPAPTKETVPEKAVLEPAVSKPASPAKAEIPVTANNSKNSGAQSHEEGLALANKSGCLACHKIETKLVGPAWRDVSKRYKGDPDAKEHLIAKVKAGGKGNWTDVTGGIAMPPYSPRVSDENIEKLVTFVLSQ